MTKGPGKYDTLCTFVRQETKAETVIMIVINGNMGSGFSVQSHWENSQELLPGLLEDVARDIRELNDKIN